MNPNAASPGGPAVRRGYAVTNLCANMANFAFSLFVGLWFTPYLIGKLGTASFGLVPLVTQVISYMTLITTLLNSVVGRYVIIALERHEHDEANKFFNTALFGNILLVLLLLVPACMAAWKIDNIIVFPQNQTTQIRWLFGFTVAAFFLATIQSPFSVATFYANRLELQSAISALQQLARVTIVVALFTLLQPQIWQVGLAALLSMGLGWGFSIRLWRQLTPMLCVTFSRFDFVTLQRLLSTGGWISINSAGAILFVAIDLLLVNQLFGAESSGRYAIAVQWSGLLRGIATVIAGVFAPTILSLYGRDNLPEMLNYTRRAMRFLGLAMALPIGLICGLSQPLLKTWMGPGFTDLAPLMSLLTIHLSVNLAVQPLFHAQTATNHVKWPAMMTCALGAVNMLLAIYFSKCLGWGLYGVAAAGAIALTAKNLLFTPLYAAHILHCPLGTFFRGMLPAIGSTIGIALIAVLITLVWHPSGWFNLALAGMSVAVGYVIFAYLAMIDDEDRMTIRRLLPNRVSRAY